MADDPKITLLVCSDGDPCAGGLHSMLIRLLELQGVQLTLSPVGNKWTGINDLNWKQSVQTFKQTGQKVYVDCLIGNPDAVKALFEWKDCFEDERPAFLHRIHWGHNRLSEKIKPAQQYLVKIRGEWHTGTFRLNGSQNGWTFSDVTGEVHGRKRYDLDREGLEGIEAIYEIAE